MIRVLHIISDLNVAGAQTVVMNYLRYSNQFPGIEMAVTVQIHSQNTRYEQECKRLGIEVHYLNYRPSKAIPLLRPLINWLQLQWLHYKDIKKYSPDIVHTHVTPLLQHTLFPIVFSGVKKRFHTLHSDPYAIDTLSVLFAKMAFHIWSFYPICVTEGQALKAEKRYRINHYSIIRNGIDLERYSKTNKEEIRKELGIDINTFVIGCIGRLNKIKNHSFLLKVFSEYNKLNPDSILLLVGEGEEKERIVSLGNDLDIKDRLMFTGLRDDVERLFSAMDLFMLTSFSESSSIVTVEAQMAGIRCVVSDSIPENVVISGLVNRIPLDAGIEKWINAIEGKIKPDATNHSPNDFSVLKAVADLRELYNKI